MALLISAGTTEQQNWRDALLHRGFKTVEHARTKSRSTCNLQRSLCYLIKAWVLEKQRSRGEKNFNTSGSTVTSEALWLY